jgi:hypothetical protein
VAGQIYNMYVTKQREVSLKLHVWLACHCCCGPCHSSCRHGPPTASPQVPAHDWRLAHPAGPTASPQVPAHDWRLARPAGAHPLQAVVGPVFQMAAVMNHLTGFNPSNIPIMQ